MTQRTLIGWVAAVAVLLALASRRLPWPLDSVLITSPFGERLDPTTGILADHNGVDLRAAVGTPVRAPDAGIIAAINTTLRGGLQVFLETVNGLRIGFAHLSRFAYPVGTEVQAGDVIAWTGASGAVRGAHLHLTVRRDGSYIDPATVFA